MYSQISLSSSRRLVQAVALLSVLAQVQSSGMGMDMGAAQEMQWAAPGVAPWAGDMTMETQVDKSAVYDDGSANGPFLDSNPAVDSEWYPQPAPPVESSPKAGLGGMMAGFADMFATMLQTAMTIGVPLLTTLLPVGIKLLAAFL